MAKLYSHFTSETAVCNDQVSTGKLPFDRSVISAHIIIPELKAAREQAIPAPLPHADVVDRLHSFRKHSLSLLRYWCLRRYY